MMLAPAASSVAAFEIPVPATFAEHPRVYLTPAEIAALKAEIARPGSRIAPRYAGFKGSRDRDIARPFTVPSPADVSAGPNSPASSGTNSAHYRLSSQARDAGILYALTGDTAYAARARDILLAYADAYNTYPVNRSKGRATSQALNESDWVIRLAWAYDQIVPSGVLTDAQRMHIEQDLLRAAIETSILPSSNRTCSNWQTWHNAALGVVGLCLGDRVYLGLALNGAYKDGKHHYGVAHQIAHDILPDGLFWERSLGYHYYALNALVQLAEAVRHAGVDLYHLQVPSQTDTLRGDRHWGYGPPNTTRSLRMMFDAPFFYRFPDGSFAQVADSRQSRQTAGELYEIAYREYRDPKYAALIRSLSSRGYGPAFVAISPDLPEGKLEWADGPFCLTGLNGGGCSLFPSTGYAILRGSPADTEATAVNLTFGPYGGGHGHPDKLGVTLYGRGAILAPDPGAFSYDSPLHVTWSKQTVAHNTVTVDETAQFPQGASENHFQDEPFYRRGTGRRSYGRLLAFEAGPLLKLVRADCEDAYDGVLLDRTIVLINPYVVDLYRVSSDQEYLYDWSLHANGAFETPVELSPQAGPLSDRMGYRHIEAVRSGKTPETWTADWIDRPASRGLRLIGLSGGEDGALVAGQGPKKEGGRRALLLVRRKTRSTTFASVLEPYRGAPIISSAGLSFVGSKADTARTAVFRVQHEGYADHLILNPSRRPVRTSGIETDAEAAFVRRQGKAIRAWSVVSGTALTADGAVLFRSEKSATAHGGG